MVIDPPDPFDVHCPKPADPSIDPDGSFDAHFPKPGDAGMGVEGMRPLGDVLTGVVTRMEQHLNVNAPWGQGREPELERDVISPSRSGIPESAEI